jgi:hypothetical protein
MSRQDKVSIVRTTVVSARIGNDFWIITNDGTVDENIPHNFQLDSDPIERIEQLNNVDLQDILDSINLPIHNDNVSLHRSYETRVNPSTGGDLSLVTGDIYSPVHNEIVPSRRLYNTRGVNPSTGGDLSLVTGDIYAPVHNEAVPSRRLSNTSGVNQSTGGDLSLVTCDIYAPVHNEAVSLPRRYETRFNQSTGGDLSLVTGDIYAPVHNEAVPSRRSNETRVNPSRGGDLSLVTGHIYAPVRNEAVPSRRRYETRQYNESTKGDLSFVTGDIKSPVHNEAVSLHCRDESSILGTDSESSGSLYTPSTNNSLHKKPNIESICSISSSNNIHEDDLNDLNCKGNLSESRRFNEIPLYDVDPFMYIMFEINKIEGKGVRGDVHTRLSADRVKKGLIEYVLAVPIFNNTIYLKRNVNTECHYGRWFCDLPAFLTEAASCKVNVLVLDGNNHEYKDYMVVHGTDCYSYPSFGTLVHQCRNKRVTDQILTQDTNRNTMSDCYGYATGNFEEDEKSKVNLPAIKTNYNVFAAQTMIILGELLNEVDHNGMFHNMNKQRQRNYAAQIGIKCGLSDSECSTLFLEGMTYNQTIIHCNQPSNVTKDEVSPSPHCDVNNDGTNGNNFLIGFSWMEYVSKNQIIRHVLLGYMRRVITQAIDRGILADSIETIVNRYLAQLPDERKYISTKYLLKEFSEHSVSEDLFLLPCNMEKEAFYSIIATNMSDYADHFKLGFFKRLELLSLLFTVNGPDRIHTVLSDWTTNNFCPKGLLPCAFMDACCAMFGSTASEGRYSRYQFFMFFGTTIDDWIYSLITIGRVCLLANEGKMK